MAFVAVRGNGAFEVRESRLTTRGPRSRTLATFRTLTPEVLQRAEERASGPFDAEQLRAAARRAGAPVAPSDSDRAGAELLAELAAGHRPRPALARALMSALGQDAPQDTASANATAAAQWVAATPQQRGRALLDLLLLGDSLPRPRARARERFPRIQSKPA